MMTRGESAAQTSGGILLSNSAATARQWRSAHSPAQISNKHTPSGMGGSEEERWEVGGGRWDGKWKLGRRIMAGRKDKSHLDIHSPE